MRMLRMLQIHTFHAQNKIFSFHKISLYNTHIYYTFLLFFTYTHFLPPHSSTQHKIIFRTKPNPKRIVFFFFGKRRRRNGKEDTSFSMVSSFSSPSLLLFIVLDKENKPSFWFRR